MADNGIYVLIILLLLLGNGENVFGANGNCLLMFLLAGLLGCGKTCNG